MASVPGFLKKYFWDVDLRDIDKTKHSRFIIERILEYGDREAVRWLENAFKPQQIKRAVCESKNISRKTANFWQFIFGLKRDKVLCLKKSFQKKQRAIWQY